jgi:hypothetical protein
MTDVIAPPMAQTLNQLVLTSELKYNASTRLQVYEEIHRSLSVVTIRVQISHIWRANPMEIKSALNYHKSEDVRLVSL